MPKRAEALLEHVPERILAALDSWKFWVGVAYAGLAAVVVALYILFSQQTQETAKRVASQRAAAQSSVSSCANGVKNGPVVAGFIAGQRAIITNSILSTTAALQAEAISDPLRKVRLASLRRLEKALSNLNTFGEIVGTTTPTKADCNRMADAVGVPRPFR